VKTWEAALRARASGHGAEADAARLAVVELETLRQRVAELHAELRAVRQHREPEEPHPGLGTHY